MNFGTLVFVEEEFLLEFDERCLQLSGSQFIAKDENYFDKNMFTRDIVLASAQSCFYFAKNITAYLKNWKME